MYLPISLLNRYTKVILILFPFIIIVLTIFNVKKDLIVFPSNVRYKLFPYTDNKPYPKTIVNVYYDSDSAIFFKYFFPSDTAKTKPDIDPFAGVAIELRKKPPFLDISKYDFIEIDASLIRAKSFIVYLKTYIDGFTDLDNWRTYYIESIQIPVHFGNTKYKIPLRHFTTPEWWWKEVGPVASELPRKADRTKLFGIDIKSSPTLIRDTEEQIIIRGIRFYKDNSLFLIIIITLIALYLIILFLFYLQKKYYRNSYDNTIGEECNRILEYIDKNFNNPSLSLGIVAKNVGIAPQRISAVLQQVHKVTFKQYLNKKRISEAKKLLIETNRTIAEIGFEVGYNNITNFNRVFKLFTSSSPTEYREKYKKD